MSVIVGLHVTTRNRDSKFPYSSSVPHLPANEYMKTRLLRQIHVRNTLRYAVTSSGSAELPVQTRFYLPSVKMSSKRPQTGSGGLSPPPLKRRQQASINRELRSFFGRARKTEALVEKAVANFFKPASEKEKEVEKISWRTVSGSLLIGKYNSNYATGERAEKSEKQRIAAFDFVRDLLLDERTNQLT